MSDAQLNALREVIRAKLRLWDATRAAEVAIGEDLDSASDGLDYFCSTLDDVSDADGLDEAALRNAFGLDSSDSSGSLKLVRLCDESRAYGPAGAPPSQKAEFPR